MDIRTILCPTDFSDPAERALEMALTLASRFDAKVVVLHVNELVPPLASAPVGGAVMPFDVASYQAARAKAAEESLAKLAERHGGPDVTLQTRVRDGLPADTIRDVASEEGADLIVIATSGRSAFNRFLFGSVAEKVIRSAPCPVLTLNAGE